ncbi:MAG: ABC transporter permease [Clostridiaceae bacterium]|nr:ABC transporter permease [Clostridiaceae bacterium]
MSNNTSSGGATITIAKRSQFKDIVRRFRKNKAAVIGVAIIAVLIICALFPGLISQSDYNAQSLRDRYQSPSSEHILGTDELGRDMFTRIVWGCRTSLTIGLSSVLMACVAGVAIGCISGFYGRTVDNILMRLIDILMAVPNMLLGISIVAALGNSIGVLIIAMGLSSMPTFARVTRAAVITVRDMEYIEAARATGASDLRIMWKYILPNALAPIIVQVSMGLAGSILTISGLSFIGLGVPAPTPEWGSMLSSGRSVIRDHPHIILYPGIAIMLSVFAFNLFGDGLRDALDPRLKT